MARRKIQEEHENLERWLVSYADFITLLFAFFVVMYAISSVNEGKYRVLSDSLVQAFKEPSATDKLIELKSQGPGLLEGGGKMIGTASPPNASQHAEKAKAVAKELQKTLASLVEKGNARVTQTDRGINVEINASTLFASGEARIQPEALPILRDVAMTLVGNNYPIQVEGHTDNVPISGFLFPSNWELSSARAGAVVRLLAEDGIDPALMAAIGYADNKPIDNNDTPEGRSRNRRVNVMILSTLNPPPSPSPSPSPNPSTRPTPGSTTNLTANPTPSPIPDSPPGSEPRLPPPLLSE